jgi:hypothetical protein
VLVYYIKTNATLLGKERYDDFHVSGYGTSLKAGLNLTFFKHFYIQGELKGGYINMQDIHYPKYRRQCFTFFRDLSLLGLNLKSNNNRKLFNGIVQDYPIF